MRLTSRDTLTYELLVLVVRFPEDRPWDRAQLDSLEFNLNRPWNSSLAGFYRAATYGHLALSAHVVGVEADHARSFYTRDGEGNRGNGIDPDAYPHNAQFLAEEATRKAQGAVDFKVFDNTGDGYADAVLLLHTGPPAPERSGPFPKDILLAHAFTMREPEVRGDILAFPYAIASIRDRLGPVAHEVGHLLGLPDLYISNPFVQGPGVGEWSLMATGALAGAGATPSGLDAASLVMLGLGSKATVGRSVTLDPGVWLRVFRANQSAGSQYFLVEQRSEEAGLWIPESATIVYLVNEDVPDNFSAAAPRVEIRAVLCQGEGFCDAVLTDATHPSLVDGDGDPTSLRFDFHDGSVTATSPGNPVTPVRVTLGEVHGDSQQIYITLCNSDLVDIHNVTLDVMARSEGGRVEVQPRESRLISLAPGETRKDSTYAFKGFLDAGTIAVDVAVDQTIYPMVLDLGDPDKLVVSDFSASLGWELEDHEWSLGALPPGADRSLRSPWFRVPHKGALWLDHGWDFASFSPQHSLDGALVTLERRLSPDVALAPEGGWGYSVEGNLGNPIGNRDVISGRGNRGYVFDLSAYAGESVRLEFRAAGDFEKQEASWRLKHVEGVTWSDCLVELAVEAPNIVKVSQSFGHCSSFRIFVYGGPSGRTPTTFIGAIEPGTLSVTDRLGVPGNARQYDAFWIEGGEAGMVTARAMLPSPVSFVLGSPCPNPVESAQSQKWTVSVPDGGVLGRYTFKLFDVSGRLVYEWSTHFFRVGNRSVDWFGTNREGMPVAPGMYFLRLAAPDGRTSARKVVVAP